MNKPWNKKQKKRTKRQIKQRILIICEGKKTEPYYFNQFKMSSTVVLDIEGTGYNTQSLVNFAIKEKNKAIKTQQPYDQVWCVFDKDSFSKSDFNTAIQKAKKNNIKVAYSNEAFELWYFLHYAYLDTAINRDAYIEKLKAHIPKYRKNLIDTYQILLKNQQKAIKNAKKLLDQYTKPNPVDDKPSTSVHLLVEELNKFLN